jgi:hypothetical protein
MRRDHALTRRTGALVLAVALLSGCGPGGDGAVVVDLGVLVEQAAEFNGRTVRTSGQLRHHADPEHHWIENPALQRVGVNSDAVASVKVGSAVEVTGQFHHAHDRGRRLEVTAIRVID